MPKISNLARAFLGDLFTGRLIRDTFFPEQNIPLNPDVLIGSIDAMVAKNLVAQGVDVQGRFLASRGYNLYQANLQKKKFELIHQFPCPMGVGQALRSHGFREVVAKRDNIHVLSLKSGHLLAHCGGQLYRQTDPDRSKFAKVFRLRHWGLKVGRGILYNGLTQLASGRILLGEYFANLNRTPVRVYASDDDGLTWYVRYEFAAGAIRHIHAIQQDPFTNEVWLCAGDTDEESRILKSPDNGESFEIVGQGSQTWRCCAVVFGKDSVFWGADTEANVPFRNIIGWSRQSQTAKILAAADGAIEFAVPLDDSLHILTTIRAGLGEVDDEFASIWISDGQKLTRIPFAERIKQVRGASAGIKAYSSVGRNLVCLSFNNLVGVDGDLAIVETPSLKNLFNTK